MKQQFVKWFCMLDHENNGQKHDIHQKTDQVQAKKKRTRGFGNKQC